MSLFGSSQPQAAQQTVASGVDIQSSVYGAVVPLIYGRARLTGNLIDYADFHAIAHTDDNGGGGKGGGGSSSGSKSYTYNASFLFALCEGAVADIQNVWASKSATAFADSKLGLANGDLSQGAWGTWSTNHPTKALAYAGTAYVYAAAYDLGNSAQLPNLSYEVTGLYANAISGLPDADPKDVVTDVLCNTRYGVGYSVPQLADLSLFSDYCRATGLVISPVFDTQGDAASLLNGIVQSCNAEFVWSGAKLTIVPYGDTALSANGATYTPPPAPLYSLTDDDFLDTRDSGDPVQCSRARPSDQMNSVRFEFLDRTNAYNAAIVEAQNQAAIEAYGLRSEQPEQMHHFCDATAAKLAATLKLQRQSVRNVYSFTLGWRYCLLDPMDIVEITDEGLGLDRQWVRILSLEEDDNGNIKVSAEEYLGGTGHAPLYSFESGQPYNADFNVAPGDVNTPLIFEPPPLMLQAVSKGHPQVMIGVSGGPDWGGCDVWLSIDDATYKRMGRIATPARQGTLTNTLANGADPDTSHTLSVLLNDGSRALHGGTQDDADSFRTLCYVDGELIAYETASLTGANAYGLTYLRRGVYGSVQAAHAAGTAFCRLDDAVATFNLPVDPVSYVGKTLYLKFLSFNIYGGGQQSLSDVTAIAYNPNGQGVFVYPPSGVSFTVGAEQQQDGSWISYGVVSWTASPDPLFDMYEVQYRLHAGPGPWISWRGGPDTTSFRISPIPANTAYDVQVRAVRTKGPFYSAWDQALNTSSVGKTTAPPAPTGLTVIGGYRQITIGWTASAENDIAWYEVWEGPDATFADASKIGQVNATHYLRPGLNLSDTRYYWIRALDTSGNFSAFLGPGHATTNAVDAGDITGKIIGSQIDNAAVTGTNLANNIIDYSKMASGYGIAASVNSLPGSGSPLRYPGSLVLLTTNAKLYRWDSIGAAWTVAVDGGDITANSIVANALVAGIITAPYIAAGAVTASKAYFGDTTNLVTDSIFADPDYWTLAGGLVSILTPSSVSQQALSTTNCVHVTPSSIPAGSTTFYAARSQAFSVRQGVFYRASCQALCTNSSVNKTAGLLVRWFDATMTQITPDTDGNGPQPFGAYAATDTGDDGNHFYSSVGATMLVGGSSNPLQAPTGAAYAMLIWFVYGGGSGSPAGVGASWNASHMRMERQTVGTLIEDGQITTDHIVSAGIDASAITAGTITGDRMLGTFIDGNNFSTVHTSGQPFIEINGKSQTVGSHQNGPWFRVNDGTHNRVIVGQLQDAWGMWLYDSSGSPFFEEASLANGVVETSHLAANAVSHAYGVTSTGGSAVLFLQTMPADGTIVFTGGMAIGDNGGPPVGKISFRVNSTEVAHSNWAHPGGSADIYVPFAYSISASAGDSIEVIAVVTNVGSGGDASFDGGSMFAVVLQR